MLLGYFNSLWSTAFSPLGSWRFRKWSNGVLGGCTGGTSRAWICEWWKKYQHILPALSIFRARFGSRGEKDKLCFLFQNAADVLRSPSQNPAGATKWLLLKVLLVSNPGSAELVLQEMFSSYLPAKGIIVPSFFQSLFQSLSMLRLKHPPLV